MIRAVMPEFQLERFAAEREPAKLVAQANPEHRHAAKQLANIFDRRMSTGSGSPGPFERNTPSRLHRQHIFRGSLRRDDRHIAAVIHQQPQDILLDPEIVGDHAYTASPAAFH